MGANSQKSQEQLIKNEKQLVELKAILQMDKSGNSFKEFIAKHGVESVSLIAQLISMTLGPK